MNESFVNFSGKQSGIIIVDLAIPTKQFEIFLTFRIEDFLIPETLSTSILYTQQQNNDEKNRKRLGAKVIDHAPILNHDYFGNDHSKKSSVSMSSLSEKINKVLFAFYTEDNTGIEMYIEITNASKKLVLEVLIGFY